MAEPKDHPTSSSRKRRGKTIAINEGIHASGERSAIVDAAVIRSASTKHGLRQNWRELEFAQLAIFQGANPPKHQDHAKLTRAVNEWLRNDPGWRASGYGGISRPTVLRALRKVFP